MRADRTRPTRRNDRPTMRSAQDHAPTKDDIELILAITLSAQLIVYKAVSLLVILRAQMHSGSLACICVGF